MLSILITVYNEDVVSLVKALRMQCRELTIAFEIIVCDDHSSENFRNINEAITSYPEVKYHYLQENVGRAKIRNILASMARYEWLLFMDGDSQVVTGSFIKNYLEAIQPGTVICGGRTYILEKPEDRKLLLHWKYGVSREKRPASLRNRFPYRSFMTSNFLCPRIVFASVSFDESIAGYGHEDTLFGYQLWQKGVPLYHIDNPLLHDGLIPVDDFLQKGKNAVANLSILYSRYGTEEELIGGIRLLRVYRLLQKWHLVSFMAGFLSAIEKFIMKNLRGRYPVLILYDLIRLHWFIQETRKE